MTGVQTCALPICQVAGGAAASSLRRRAGSAREGGREREGAREHVMGQCVTKCKNPTSSLGSKSGEKDAGKSHKKGGGGGGGTGGHKDESKFPADVNGTKSPEVTVETSVAPPLSSGGPQQVLGMKAHCCSFK